MNQIELCTSLESLGNIRINKKTSVEQLVEFAVKAEHAFRLNDTQNLVVRWRQGRALLEARRRFSGKGGWKRYIESQGISPMTDSRARRLAEAIKSESACKGMTLTEAYRNLLKPKTTRQKPKKAVADTVPTPPRARIEAREEEMTALYQFLSVVGSWERARDLLEAGEALLESPEKREPSPETREEAVSV